MVRSGGPVTTTALSTWTIAGWLNPTGNGSAETIEINGTAGAFINFDCRNNQCILDVNDNAGHSAALSSVSLISAGWFHYTGTWDGTTLRLYVNGVQDATSATAFNFTGNNWSDMQIGPFDGQLQDGIFYNAAITANEVAQMYAQRRPARRTNLIAHITLLDLSGTDYSGLGNNFTNAGTTAGTSAPPAGWGSAHPHFFTSGSTTNITVAGATQSTGAVTVPATASAASTGSVQTTGAVSIASSATLVVAGSTRSTGAAANTSASGLAAAGVVQGVGAAVVPSTSGLAAAGLTQSTASSVVVTASQGSMTATSAVQSTGAASIASGAPLAGAGSVQSVGSASMPSTASLAASAVVQTTGAAALAATASIAATGPLQSTGSASVTSAASGGGSATTQTAGAVALSLGLSISATGSIATSGAVVVAPSSPVASAGSMQTTGLVAVNRSSQQVYGIPKVFARGHLTIVHMRTSR